MQVSDELIRNVVQEVLSHMRNGKATPTNGKTSRWGVFDDVDSAVAALSSILEPLLIVVVGSIAGAIILALYLPIFNLGNAMRGGGRV